MGRPRGYRNHPQLVRFQAQTSPVSAINSYLLGIHAEAVVRGYSFDPSKIGSERIEVLISVTSGQVAYEWLHLLRKLALRNPALHQRYCDEHEPECHPLFEVRTGPVESWERQQVGA